MKVVVGWVVHVGDSDCDDSDDDNNNDDDDNND